MLPKITHERGGVYFYRQSIKIETPPFTRKKVTMIHVITKSWFVGELKKRNFQNLFDSDYFYQAKPWRFTRIIGGI